jgi:hypothetical protein
MSTDFRSLCAELIKIIEEHCNPDEYALLDVANVLSRARAALAAVPVGEGPSERIVSIAKAVQECAFAHEPDARLIGNVCAEDVADLCSAALPRWGCPAAPPAPEVGEVGEVCEWLENHAAHLRKMQEIGALPETELQEMLSRTATLLSQLFALAAPAVVPAGEGPSERIISIAKAVQECAFAHEPDARLIGNVCAEDVADLCSAILARWGRPATPPAPPKAGEAIQPAGRSGLTWEDAIHGLRDVLADQTEDAIQRVWQRSRIVTAMDLMAANTPTPPAPEVDSRARELRRLLAVLLDFLCLPGHGVTEEDWRQACVLSGRYCEPFLSKSPATPPAPEVGEVAELVRRLRDLHSIPLLEERERAATLLEQQQHLLKLAGAELDRLVEQQAAPAPAVVPVAVSERLPDSRPESEGGDCDAEGRCWAFMPRSATPFPNWTLIWRGHMQPYHTHWRPASAIPLPHAGEVEG